MSNWLGTLAYLAFFFASVGIRVPHDRVSKATNTVDNRKSTLEKILLGLMAVATLLLPLLSLTPLLAFADYSPNPIQGPFGLICLVEYLWLFFRAHADLGRNWSATLEIREGHQLIDQGVYKMIRHPMYSAIYLMAVGQALIIPNWIAGPASLVAFSLMFFLRVHPEEQMMRDRFGVQYEEYCTRTRRLIPGIW